MEPVAFTLREEKLTAEIVTPCRVCEAKSSTEVFSLSDMTEVSALWDTGATASVISDTLAKQLHLEPVTQCMTYHAQGQKLVNVYLIDLVLPNRILVRGVRVTEGQLNGFGMLLGMDIINLGDFTITHRDRKTVFSFQIPSTHEYDFVKQIQQGVGQKKKK